MKLRTWLLISFAIIILVIIDRHATYGWWSIGGEVFLPLIWFGYYIARDIYKQH